MFSLPHPVLQTLWILIHKSYLIVCVCVCIPRIINTHIFDTLIARWYRKRSQTIIIFLLSRQWRWLAFEAVILFNFKLRWGKISFSMFLRLGCCGEASAISPLLRLYIWGCLISRHPKRSRFHMQRGLYVPLSWFFWHLHSYTCLHW